MTFLQAIRVGAVGVAVAAYAGAAMARASDAVKSAPTRNDPGSSEGMLPANRATPQNAPGAAEGRSASGSKSNAEAEKVNQEGRPGAAPPASAPTR